MWEILGTDVFEYPFVKDDGEVMKVKGAVWLDRATRACSVSIMQEYQDHWEPNTQCIIKHFIRDWLAYYPRPHWFASDSALYFTSEEMSHFLRRSGVGHITAPPEAHCG